MTDAAIGHQTFEICLSERQHTSIENPDHPQPHRDRSEGLRSAPETTAR